MSKSMKACLEEAADLIEEKGWGQRLYWAKFGPTEADRGDFCLLGACLTACPKRGEDEFAGFLGFYSPMEAARWNDADSRSAEEVIARLREYAAKQPE